MKNTVLLLLSILILSSCENFDEPIPDGSVLETPRLTASVVAADKVELSWNSEQFCAGDCPSLAPATTYEIWTKSLTSTISYKFDEIPAGQMSYLVEGLEPGVRQEFFVIAKRADVSNKTNRVMVVPNELPEAETVFEKEGADYITHPQVSPSGDQVAYAVSQSGSFSSPQKVFVYDLASKSHELVSDNGKYPSWSGVGDKLVVVSEGTGISTIKEITLTSGAVQDVVSDSFQSYFPVFGTSDTTMIYFLDSLDEGDQSIISFNLDEKATNPKRQLRDVVYSENAPAPMLGMSYSEDENAVAYGVTFPKETETGYSYDIVGFALTSPSALNNYVVSDWNDSNPSFSRADPDLLAFVSDRSGAAQVWVKNISTQQLVQVTDFQENEWINTGIAGLSWFGEKLYCNTQNAQRQTRMLVIEVSSLL